MYPGVVCDYVRQENTTVLSWPPNSPGLPTPLASQLPWPPNSPGLPTLLTSTIL
ncbi:hypothetical protein BGX20_006893, partial [Mortierella sp. AD010]